MAFNELEIFDRFGTYSKPEGHSSSFDVEHVGPEVVTNGTRTFGNWFTDVLGLFGDLAQHKIIIVVADFKVYKLYVVDVCGKGTQELFSGFGQ
jgi:hypothetical protein